MNRVCLDTSSKVSKMDSQCTRDGFVGRSVFSADGQLPRCGSYTSGKRGNIWSTHSRRLQRVWASSPLHSYSHGRMIGQMETSEEGFPHSRPRVARGGGRGEEEEAEAGLLDEYGASLLLNDVLGLRFEHDLPGALFWKGRQPKQQNGGREGERT